MRFVCSTFGSAGDVFPMLGLAIELQERGHDITFATNEHFSDVVQRHGLRYESLGDDEQFVTCIQNPDLWHPRRSFRHIFESLQPAIRRQYQIYDEHARLGEVAGITNCFGFGALLAQDKLKVPVITMHLQPAVLWSDHKPPALPGMAGPRWLRRIFFRLGERFYVDPVVLPFLNNWRHELGLAPVRQIARWWTSRYGVLCTFPKWYAEPQPDWPDHVMQTDFPLWNDRANEALDEEVTAFLDRGEAPIVFTPGSANLHGRAFFEAAVQACTMLGRRAILLTQFPEQIPSDLPESTIHFSYVPLDSLLPHAAAFVHHGGIGSTSQAMLAGIPQVIMPLAHDQFDNAERLKCMGIGESIPVHQFTGSRLCDTLRKLLRSQLVEAACQEYAKRLTPRNGLQLSAIAIEERLRIIR